MRLFITMSTTACYLSLSLARSKHIMPSNPRSIRCIIIPFSHLCLVHPSAFYHSGFQTKNLHALSPPPTLHIRGVIKKYGECLNKKKNYYSKRLIDTNPPQNTPPRFEHTYPIVLATFWSSSGSPLSWVSLVALSCSLDVLNWFKTFTFHGHFDFWEEPEVARCQIRWIRWMRTNHNISV